MSAAVADYRPAAYSSSKIKKSDNDLVIELERTEDILLSLGRAKKPGQILVGFAAETDDLLQNAQSKLERILPENSVAFCGTTPMWVRRSLLS